ncbi:Complement factor H [Myotis davidii]|uniref:Complement factor H n=1 Tax=Myotis davidii TaxID=225400 RepID=L5LMV9_MYODS|nr:Complement factor H [Myotis davidii]
MHLNDRCIRDPLFSLGLPCGSPPPVQNGFIPNQKPNYGHGDTARYECRHPLGLIGKAEVTCLSGKWTDPPECTDVSCGSPPSVQNAFIPNQKPRYQHGDIAHYQCRHPLGLLGKAVVICLSGKWTDPPECKEATGQCGPPPAIDNGDITTYPLAVYALWSSVEYQCQASYQLKGNRRIMCRDGQWSEPPKCLGKSFNIPLDSEKISFTDYDKILMN